MWFPLHEKEASWLPVLGVVVVNMDVAWLWSYGGGVVGFEFTEAQPQKSVHLAWCYIYGDRELPTFTH